MLDVTGGLSSTVWVAHSSFHMVEIKRVRAHGVRDSMLYSILFDVAILADGSRRWGLCCGV